MYSTGKENLMPMDPAIPHKCIECRENPCFCDQWHGYCESCWYCQELTRREVGKKKETKPDDN